MSRRWYFPGAAPGLVLAAWFGIFATHGAAAAEPPTGLPILGVDPLEKGAHLEYHQDALAHWVARGFSGAFLVHVDANSGMGPIPAGNIAKLKDLVSRRDTELLTRGGRSGANGLFHEGNFVRAASRLGIVREVLWIAPIAFPPGGATEALMQDELARAGLSSLEKGSFRAVDGCFRGRVEDVPVSLCAQERLPPVDGPVLLSVDADFFPAAAVERTILPLLEIRALFSALRAARYAVVDALVAFSVQEGELPPDLRWVGEAVGQVLQDPALVQASEPPERLLALQKLSQLESEGQQRRMEMLGLALSHLETHPHDPAFLLYAAEAADSHGGGERALSYAEEACRMDRGYCAGLREFGLRLFERGDVELGLRFFAAGEMLLPGMEYGQLDMGIALMRAGRTEEALAALDKVRERDGDFPSGFLIGATHLFKGDRAAARRAFDAALTALERSGDVRVVRSEIARVIASAAAYYREERLVRQAERLESDPGLRLPPPQDRP